MYIKLKVIAGAKKEKVEVVSPDHINISVREKAEQNAANTRILEILREKFPGRVIRMISGHHAPSKIVSVEETN